MTLQTFAAVAAMVDLAVIVSACGAGILLARGTRLPEWTAAAAVLLIIRAISVTTTHAWATPSAPDTFPVIDAVVGTLALTGISFERWRARTRLVDTVNVTSIELPGPGQPIIAEAHVDAA